MKGRELTQRWAIGFIILICTQSWAHAQEITAGSSLPGKFSISITSDYHFSPWNELNDMLGVIGEQVKFNPIEYQNTTGSYDRIDGDMSFRLKVAYRVSGPVRIFLTSSYVRTGSDMNLNNSYEFLWGGAANQSMSFGLNVYSVGAGAEYTYRLSKRFSLTASILGERSFGMMHFASESLSPGERLTGVADMKSEVWSGQASVGVRMHLYGKVALLAAIDYRLLRFPAFTGSGSYMGINAPSPTPWISVNSSTKLVEGDHYLGVLYDTGGELAPYPAPYQLSPAWSENPAVLNLSGLGGSLGIEIEL